MHFMLERHSDSPISFVLSDVAVLSEMHNKSSHSHPQENWTRNPRTFSVEKFDLSSFV